MMLHEKLTQARKEFHHNFLFRHANPEVHLKYMGAAFKFHYFSLQSSDAVKRQPQWTHRLLRYEYQ